MNIGIPEVDLLIKSTCIDLKLFNFMHHFLVHYKTENSSFCNLCFASFSVVATDKIAGHRHI